MIFRSPLGCSKLVYPVIAVCGATGTGKSKLAVDLAKLFNAEVVNSDAIQLYNGLNIATNKISDSERAGILHHLIGVLSPDSGHGFDVHSYRDACLPIIEQIRNVKQRPAILVGGTHYYMEAILWQDFLSSKDSHFAEKADDIQTSQYFDDPIKCYNHLCSLDPARAARLHPNNLRKVKKALIEVMSSSKAGEEPNKSDLGVLSPNLGRPMNRSYEPRFPEQSLILWLDCASDVLDKQLNKRVDKMLDDGLLNELDEFLNTTSINNIVSNEDSSSKSDTIETSDYRKRRAGSVVSLFSKDRESSSNPLCRRGILQSIGFKEFADYLSLSPNSGERDTAEAKLLLKESIERMKISTRQYTRRQIRWIVNRFLRRPVQGSIPVYRLDVTNAWSSPRRFWELNILAPAARLVYNQIVQMNNSFDDSRLEKRLENLLRSCPSDLCPKPEQIAFQQKYDLNLENVEPPFKCETCDRIFTEYDNWQSHVKSRSHHRRVTKVRRQSIVKQIINQSNTD